MAQITSIGIGCSTNYVKYNDSDSMTDYHHGYSLNQKMTAEWLRTDGADVVIVNLTDRDAPHERRVKLMAKRAGYTFVRDDSERPVMGGGTVTDVHYTLTKAA